MVSALNGISTEVETFSRKTVRPFDFLADVFERQVRARENAARQPLALANQAEQQVLGFDRDAAELARFVAGEEQHAARSFRVAFEHLIVRRRKAGPILSHYTACRAGRRSARRSGVHPMRLGPTRLPAPTQSTHRPPSRRSARSQEAARAGLWVTMIEVRPCSRCISRSSACRSCAVASSRLPVGSSASSSVGRVTSARARAPRAAARRPTARPAGA